MPSIAKKADGSEQHPSERTPDADQRNGDIGAEHQQEDIAVIDDSEHSFPFQPGREGVIDAGDRIKDDQRGTEQGDGGDPDRAVRPYGHQNQRGYAEHGSYPVGDRIEKFLAERIGGNTDSGLLHNGCVFHSVSFLSPNPVF